MIKSMAEKPIVFALANPEPEIMPDKALSYGAFIVGTGRSDFPNQINNVLAFPGIFKGVLSIRAKEITEKMKLAAAYAIANVIPEHELKTDNIIPSPLNKAVALSVADGLRKRDKTETWLNIGIFMMKTASRWYPSAGTYEKRRISFMVEIWTINSNREILHQRHLKTSHTYGSVREGV